MAAAWSNLSDAAKKPYEKSADKARDTYTKKREKYISSTSYRKHQEAVAEWKKAEGSKPFRKDTNRPKRPASGYLLFVNAERPDLMKKGLSVTEVASKAAKMWKQLSSGDRERYEKKAASLKSKYAKEVAAYEKSGKYKQYMKEKEAFEADRKAKRKASSSAGPPKKKARVPKASKSRSRTARRRASVPKGSSKNRSASTSKSRSRSVSRRASVPRSSSKSRSRSVSRRRARVPR